MNKVFFSSDWHGFHGNIMRYCNRPGLNDEEQEKLKKGEKFKVSQESVERMNAYIIDNINKTVGENDDLWFLGDFIFGSKGQYYSKAKHFRSQIRCKNIWAIWGNHDRPSIADLFCETYNYREIVVSNQLFILSHYALAVWNKSHRGSICLYAHSHSSAEDWLDKIIPGRRSMDVGIDNAAKLLGEYRPFSMPEIMNLMKSRAGHSIDHHKQEPLNE